MTENLKFPWGPAAATGVGSMPGEDAREAVRVVVGSLDALPHLPELPARGPGADMIGRTTGLLAELWAHVEPSGWRVSDRPGRDTRRARAWLREDLDALEEFTQGYEGALKVSAVGPWTLAASLERRNGEAMLGDPGARRDLAASLAEGLSSHLADVRRRVPGATVVLQLDEPSLPAVLTAQVPTASGYRTHRAVDPAVAEEALRGLIAVAGDDPVVVHCCAPGVPFGLLRRAGATGISCDMRLLTERDDDAVGEAIEGGAALFAGVVPGAGAEPAALSDPAGTVGGVRSLWRRLGLYPGLLGESVVITPACGLAGASPAYARAALETCARAARSLADNPE
ncbi:methionine synthase [Streptomyces radicis]|uniref:Methionine synthase n=1 Tax=Streptomyces radicis TaxID=1750517 RepID=A0A3A9W8S7_9ACTN|nr:methionine synthase [Streptomyces radicis]RKN09270.1 methionine synthase [Streptomyces radicis]RKN23132.1 methionine synthase [Streptomyces radicis]